MAREPSHAGKLRERVAFLRRGVDANGDRLGPFADWLERWAEVESDPGPMRVAAQRLEGQFPIVVTVRADPNTRLIDTAARMTWALSPGLTYLVKSTTISADRAWVTIWACAEAGGPGA